MKNLFINQLQEGQQLREQFLVARKQLMETKNGKPYLALTLMDSTGEIEARVWENAAALDAVAEVGRVVVAHAQAKSYREKLQLGINSLEQVPAHQVQLEHFMPSSPRPLAEMQEELLAVIASLSDGGLQRLLREIFQGETLERFLRAPAAKMMHHAYIGGLVEHTLSLATLAGRVQEQYPGLDRDLLLAACLLHDLAKITEFEYAMPPFDYTDQGRLLGHIVLGAEMVRKAAENVPDLSRERLDALTHIILSHHGRLEFGSPVLPMTPEAIIFHHLDDMDAKMNYLDRLAASLPAETGPGWTEYQRPLERFLYLRNPASPDVPGCAADGVPETGDRSALPGDGQPERYAAEKRQRSLF